MATASHSSHGINAEDSANDINLCEIWLRKDPARWIAGVLAGLFAGAVMAAFACALFSVAGYEFWFPVKVAALPFLGNQATAVGMQPGLIIGFVVIELLAAFLGFVYAHFTGTNSLPALLGMGFTWGAFSWIFIHNLFLPSFRAVTAAQLPQSLAFPVCMVFGISLTSVAFFDRMLRGKR